MRSVLLSEACSRYTFIGAVSYLQPTSLHLNPPYPALLVSYLQPTSLHLIILPYVTLSLLYRQCPPHSQAHLIPSRCFPFHPVLSYSHPNRTQPTPLHRILDFPINLISDIASHPKYLLSHSCPIPSPLTSHPYPTLNQSHPIHLISNSVHPVPVFICVLHPTYDLLLTTYYLLLTTY